MELLIPKSEYIKYRINRGNLKKNKKMERFISWKTSSGRNIFNIQEIDKRLRIAAKFLLNKEVVVVSTKLDKDYVEKFCNYLGFVHISHYKASIFSNPLNKEFYEPDAIFITNVDQHRNVIEEANLNRIPTIAFCNTNSDTSGIDLIIPLNTTNKKAIAVALWLILNEIRKMKGEEGITLEDFVKKEEQS
jgi:ribosomal protein uS2